VIEVVLPIVASSVLIDHQHVGDTSQTISLFLDPRIGLVLLRRHGKMVYRHVLSGALACLSGIGRIHFKFDAQQDKWELGYFVVGSAEKTLRTIKGCGLAGFDTGVMHLTCTDFGQVRKHPSVLWFGLVRGEAPPATAPWIGARTLLQTPHGPTAAGYLKPGDLVQTVDQGLVPVIRVTHLDLPSRGSFAPILLRAPYFGSSFDLLVAADQRIRMTGPEVEYLFDEEAVLVVASALVDNRTALADQRRPVTSSVVVDFGKPVLVDVDDCVLSLCPTQANPELRTLAPFEVMTLRSLSDCANLRKYA
jgi:hypothetical protein